MENKEESPAWRFIKNHPIIWIALALYASTWGSLFIHLFGTTLLLAGVIFYLYHSRFQEGRSYERAIQESRHPDFHEIRQSAHADLITGLKQAIGIEKKS
jgi:hypothetical protein